MAYHCDSGNWRTDLDNDSLREMNEEQAKRDGYTHHAKMYGFSGYANLDDDAHNTFHGKYWLTDIMVECLIYIEQFIPFDENGFKILLGDKL